MVRAAKGVSRWLVPCVHMSGVLSCPATQVHGSSHAPGQWLLGVSGAFFKSVIVMSS